jgi:predicted Zn-dependent peptidase
MKPFRTISIVTLLAGFVLLSPAQTSNKPLQYKKLKFPPLREIQLPEPARFQPANGMIIYLLEDHTLPLIQGSVLVRTGSRYEPADKIGLASMTGQVMRTGGTTSKTGDELDEMLERVGASVETYIGTTSGGARLSVLKEDIDMGLGVLADVLRNPAFRDDKIELAKVAARSSISRRNDQVTAIAAREFRRLIYGPNHPYARMTEYATIDNISKQDLIDFHKKAFVPNNMMVAFWGDFKTVEMKSKLEKMFGDWGRQDVSFLPVPSPRLAAQKTVNFIRKDDVNQSNIYLGHLGGLLNDPESGPLNVADQAFGGAAASRLFKKVRSDQGLAYAVGSFWGESYDYPGVFQMSGSTKSGTTMKMIRSIEHEFDNFIKNGITGDELKYAKDSYLNSFVFRYDTKGKIINELMTLEYFGYPKDFIQKQQQEVQQATIASVDDAVKKRWNPDALTLLVVGKDSDFDEPLSSLGMNVKTIDITIPQPPVKLPDPTPETIARGKEILGKSVAAMGGPALLGIKDIVINEKVLQSTPMGDFTIETDLKIVRPNKIAMEMKTPMGNLQMVFDGTNAWMKGAMGTRDIGGAQRQELENQLIGDVYLILQNLGKPEFTAQYWKDDTANGKTVNVVLVRYSPTNYVVRLLVDPTSGLVLKKIARGTGPSGPADVEEVYSDYRMADGVQFPYKTVSTADGKRVSEALINTLKVNSGVKDEVFKK